MDNLESSTLKIFLAKFGNAGLMFGGVVFFTRVLTPTELGTYFLFYSVVGILTIPADLGIRGALEKRLSEGQNPEEMLGSAIAFKCVTVLLVVTGIWIAGGTINHYLGAPLAGLLIGVLVVWEFSKLYIKAMRGEFQVGETAVIVFARRLIWIGFGTVLLHFGFGVRGIVYAMFLGGLVSLIWAFLSLDTTVAYPSRAGIKSLFKYSRYHFISHVGARLYQWMDLLIIGYFLSKSLVGAYEVAWQISVLILLASNSIATAFFPQMSEWGAEDALNKIESLASQGLMVVLFFSLPAFVGSLVLSEQILSQVYGPEYTIATGVLIVLMLEKLFQSANDILGNTLRALDRPDLVAIAFGGTVIINAVLDVLLVIEIGILGVAIGTAVSWIFNTVIMLWYLSQHIELQIPVSLLGFCGLSSFVMGGVLSLARLIVPITSTIHLLTFVTGGAGIYLLIGWHINPIRVKFLQPAVDRLAERIGGSMTFFSS